MRYLPHTAEEVRSMLDAAGRGSIEELFATIPAAARFQGALDVPPALGESQLMRHLRELGRENRAAGCLSFLGAGMYAHHIPPAVDQLLLRSEFYTAYTPYQPEVAQGTLLAIWEFQTMVSELFGLPLANASLYDGASAAAEGVLMAKRLTGRSKILACQSVHPHYRQTIVSYLSGGTEESVFEQPLSRSGGVDTEALASRIDEDTAAVIVGYPSYVGPLTDLRALSQACAAKGALLIAAVVEPYALALAESPGALGADIVVGEGQPLACPPQYGGPGVGLFACKDERKFLQQLPGRVCGETVDSQGKRGFVLTLSTREQHIRRERATSNVCTNQGLIALAFAIRMSLLGRTGFQAVAHQCLAKAQYLRSQLLLLPGISPAFGEAPFFNEFAVRCSKERGPASVVLGRLEAQGIIAGYDLGRADPALADCLLIAVTEEHSRADLDRLVTALAAS
jgi:glycine dehydrogenase subunit 1